MHAWPARRLPKSCTRFLPSARSTTLRLAFRLNERRACLPFPGHVDGERSAESTLREGSAGKLLSGKRPGRILGRVARGKITLWKVARPNYSREIGSGKLLPGTCFGRITFGKVVRGNHSRGGGSAELLSGRWFGKITLRGVVRQRKDTREGVQAVNMR